MKILLSGCCGRMGRVVTRLAEEQEDAVIVAGVDVAPGDGLPYPVYATFDDVKEAADVVLDFSNASGIDGLLVYAVNRNLPVVIATTGLSQSQQQAVEAASRSIPVFASGNMSLGVNLMAALVKKAAQILGDKADIEIVEAHHNQKVDAPSGTAYMLLKAVNNGLEQDRMPEYDRHSRRQKRPKNEIGMHSLRGGTIVGEHQVIFAGQDEIVTISHSARSREIFAVGALKAAAFVVGKQPGMYDMNDLIGD